MNCLHDAGANVCAFLLSDSNKVQGDARASLDAFKAIGGTILEVLSEKDLQKAQSQLSNATLFVDALLGTGLAKEVTGLYRNVIESVNETKNAPVIAVDIPSGINASTGSVMGCAMRAHSTCTFGLPKYGHMLFPGAAHTGKLAVIDIGIPADIVEQAKLPGSLQDANDFSTAFPVRARGAHKGDFGHVLLLAGSVGKTGAAVLCAQAAMKTGAGLVTIATPEKAQPHSAAHLLECMSEPVPDCDGGLGRGALQHILDMCEGKTVLAMGPGLGDTDAVAAIVRSVIEKSGLPMVMDADALNALSRDPQVLAAADNPAILTPHPGEMARLSGKTPIQVQSDRIGSACKLAEKLNVIVVLKGANTVIAAPDGRHWINTSGNPAMAGGGMGDALTGIIAGLLAQGVAPLTAARLAVFMHGRIADILVQERGPAPVLASEIIARIPESINECSV